MEIYGKEAKIEFEGITYTFAPLVDGEEIVAEWRVFKGVLAKEKKGIMEKKKLTKPPTLQDVKACRDRVFRCIRRHLLRDFQVIGHLTGSPGGNSYH